MRPALSLALLLGFTLLAPAQTADQKKQTITYLQNLQSKEGGFRLNPKAAPSLRATSSCLRALKYFGGKPRDLEGCEKFVLACYDERTGAFADTPGGKLDVIVTSVGLMALAELKIPTRKYFPEAAGYFAANAKTFEQIRMVAAGFEVMGMKPVGNSQWLNDLARQQNPDGTFGKGKGLARDTGSAIACILRLGGKVEHKQGVLTALDAAQRKDGAFGKAEEDGSDLETTYRVMRTYVMLGALPGKPKDVEAFVAHCRNSDGGYGVAPGATSTASGTYFAGIILHWLGRK